MTHHTAHVATQHQAAISPFHARRRARRAAPAPSRSHRWDASVDLVSIDELIQRAIADQPPQLYRGGA
jgi:hypothetical protein